MKYIDFRRRHSPLETPERDANYFACYAVRGRWARKWLIRLFIITELSFPEKASTAIVEEEEELDDKKGLLGKEVFGHEVSWPTRRKWLKDMCLWDTSKS